jgi:cysteine-rich repeat protein
MKTAVVGWVAAGAVMAACGPTHVDLGGEPADAGEGTGASGGTAGAMDGTGGSPGGSGGKPGDTGGQPGRPPACGNAVVDGNEFCDDGNDVSGDGCDATCSPEPGYACTAGLICVATCGDGIVAGGERCDDGNHVNDDECPNDCGQAFTVECTDAVEPPAAPDEGDPQGPCDIYAADGGPCVAAHSTVRALYATYGGPLYQLRRSDGAMLDIHPVERGGLAAARNQDAFCDGYACTISIIYDQSGHSNHLTKSPPGGAKPTPGNEANASAVSAMLGGSKVYGVHVVPGVGYRNNSACGTATGDDAETEYMVVAGDFYNGGCCFDYGNMERNGHDNGEGAAEAIYFGSVTLWGKGDGVGPWVMGDLENGLWAGDVSPYANNPSLSFAYVTGMLKGDAPGTNHWTIKTGDAQGGELETSFDGARPSARYNPMRKEGAIGLGTSGDNSNSGQGDFFEGVMTAHYSSDAADDAVQASIASVYSAR